MPKPKSEESDIPFVGNDWKGRPGTMGNDLEAADAPGKADSEMGEDSVHEQVIGVRRGKPDTAARLGDIEVKARRPDGSPNNPRSGR